MWVKILLLLFVFSFLFKTDDSFNQDLGRHIKLGEIIWQTKSVPKTNLFSYTYPDFPFINTHWLFEVLTFFMNQTVGLQTFLVAKIIIFLISVYLILKLVPQKTSTLLLPVGFIFLHVLRERTELRPEIFSFFFTVSTYYILERYIRGPTKLIFFLPVIQLLWINTHIYFFVGLVVQAIFLVHFGYQYLRFRLETVKLKMLGVVFLLSALVSLINPYGLTTILYPLNVTKNYGYTIVENQTMFLLESISFRDHNFLFVKISLAIIILSLVVAFFKRRFEVKNILLAGFGAILALLNVRSFPYLVFLSLPATLQNFGPVKRGNTTKILIIVFSGILLLESYFYLNGDYYRERDEDNRVGLSLEESGKKTLDFVINQDLPAPIYNNFDIGSYIIYRGYPKYRVFVDGRPEAYPKEFFQDIYISSQYEPQRFKELDQKIGFKTIIFSITDQTPWGQAFLKSIVKNPEWKTAYIDDFMIVLVKNDVLEEQKLRALDLSKLDPSTYPFDYYLADLRLSLFLAETGNLQSAEKFARAGLALFPQSPIGNALFGIEVKNKSFW